MLHDDVRCFVVVVVVVVVVVDSAVQVNSLLHHANTAVGPGAYVEVLIGGGEGATRRPVIVMTFLVVSLRLCYLRRH